MAFQESLAHRAPAACKIEATYNEDPTLDPSTMGFLTFDSHVTWGPDIPMQDEQVHSRSFTQRKKTPGRELVTQDLTVLFQGGTAAGVADKHSPLLRACGLHETITASTSVGYTPATREQLVSCKLGVDHDGTLFESPGLVGNFILTATPNGAIRVRFQMRGKRKTVTYSTSAYNTWAGGAKRARPFKTSDGFTMANASKTLAPVVSSFEFNRGITVDEIESGNDSTGLAKLYHGEIKPTLTCNFALNRTPGGSEITFQDFIADWVGQLTHDVGLAMTGGAAGNNLALDFPELQVEDARPVRVRNHRGVQVRYWVQHQTDGSEFSMLWT